jgi:Fic family protein
MKTANEMKAQILSRADEDGAFRERLIADPKATISAEFGTTIPEGFDVAVHEDSATTAHLVLPPSPELTEAELELVSGGNLWQQKIGSQYG